MESICPLFWGLNPSKGGLFQSKQGSFGFQAASHPKMPVASANRRFLEGFTATVAGMGTSQSMILCNYTYYILYMYIYILNQYRANYIDIQYCKLIWLYTMNLMTSPTSNLDSPLLPWWNTQEAWLIPSICLPSNFDWGCWADSWLCSPGNLSLCGVGAWSIVVSLWKMAWVEDVWKRRA